MIGMAETMIKAEDSRDPDLSIVVTAYQWKWHYKYLGEDVEFFSNLTTQFDIYTTPGHVGSDCDRTRAPGIGDNFRLALMLFGVKDVMIDALTFEHTGQCL